jgi:shikimate kinase
MNCGLSSRACTPPWAREARRPGTSGRSSGAAPYAAVVKRVLLTGMSGTGKSSVVRALAARGYKAVDTDDGWCEPLPDGRQQWRADAIAALLATEDADVLFVAGCEENQARFRSDFDHVILLSAPAGVLLDRLATRTTNPFGKAPAELSRILADLAEVEPVLRRVADHEVGTTMPLTDVVDTVLRLVGERPTRPAAARAARDRHQPRQ